MMVTKEILSLVAKNIGDCWPAVSQAIQLSQEIEAEVECIKLKCGDNMKERVYASGDHNEINIDVSFVNMCINKHISLSQ